MGEILKFDLSKKKKKEKKPKEEKLEEDKPVDFGKGFKNIMDSMDEYHPVGLTMKLLFSGTKIHERIEEIKKGTEGFSQDVFAERQERVRKYTNDQLIRFLAQSNSAEWHEDPAFYRAIINEVLERLKMIVGDDK